MRIQCENKDIKLDVNFFLELFMKNGFFNQYLENLYGVSTFNFQKAIFQVTFNKETHSTIIDYLLNHYSKPKPIITKTGVKIFLTTKKPEPPARRVTLYPMPFNVNDEIIHEICKTWGKIRNYEFGRHKICPQIRNPYLHIFILNPLTHNIPSKITVNERSITVTIEGQEQQPRCIYCKATTHLISNCPIKPATRSKPSYADMLFKPKEIPQKTQENFPTLKPTSPSNQNQEKNRYTQLSDQGSTSEIESTESSDEEQPSPNIEILRNLVNENKKRKTPPSSPSPKKTSQQNHQTSKKVVLNKPPNKRR